MLAGLYENGRKEYTSPLRLNIFTLVFGLNGKWITIISSMADASTSEQFFKSFRWEQTMPLPLSLAFWGLGAARQFHSAGATARPYLLRRVYYARIMAYVVTAVTIASDVSLPKESSRDAFATMIIV